MQHAPIHLIRPCLNNSTQPQFLSITVLPHKGMHLLQITAYLPGTGVIELLYSPSLTEAEHLFADKQDPWGNTAFKMGCAFLLPFANRIRGTLMPDGKTIATQIAGQKILLPANNSGTEKHAIHGLMYALPFTQVHYENNLEKSTLSGVLNAGNFNGHWCSQTQIRVEMHLENTLLDMAITAKNSGQALLPMGIGAHPYFTIPSKDRKQVKLYLPAKNRALVNNYTDVFPNGKITPVKNTPYDFTAVAGTTLGNLYLDDSFTQLQRENNTAVITVVDPAADYGLKIHALSPEIKTIQVYAPADKNFIAIEPQFNLGDPYNKNWQDIDTGMKLLQPGEMTCWRVRLELFVPTFSCKAEGSTHKTWKKQKVIKFTQSQDSVIPAATKHYKYT